MNVQPATIDRIAAAVCVFRDPEWIHHPDRPTCKFSRDIVELVLAELGEGDA